MEKSDFTLKKYNSGNIWQYSTVFRLVLCWAVHSEGNKLIIGLALFHISDITHRERCSLSNAQYDLSQCISITDHSLHFSLVENSCFFIPKDHVLLLANQLTLQRGVTSTARHSVNITCRGVTSPARHAARSHSFVYISTS